VNGKFLAWRAYEEGEDREVILSGDENVSRSVRYSLRQASTYVPNSLDVVPTSFLGSAVPIVVFFRDVTVDGMFVCESGRTGEYSACQLCESPLVWRRCNRLGYL